MGSRRHKACPGNAAETPLQRPLWATRPVLQKNGCGVPLTGMSRWPLSLADQEPNATPPLTQRTMARKRSRVRRDSHHSTSTAPAALPDEAEEAKIVGGRPVRATSPAGSSWAPPGRRTPTEATRTQGTLYPGPHCLTAAERGYFADYATLPDDRLEHALSCAGCEAVLASGPVNAKALARHAEALGRELRLASEHIRQHAPKAGPGWDVIHAALVAGVTEAPPARQEVAPVSQPGRTDRPELAGVSRR